MPVDDTHDPARRSWVESANDPAGDFPIQNLPYGVFRRGGRDEAPRIGVAIGDHVLDLREAIARRFLQAISPEAACALSATTLSPFMQLGRPHWVAARRAIAALLDVASKDASETRTALAPLRDVQMLLPAMIGDYTDFYASLPHATNVGSMFRPDNPLLPNWKHLPVGYHGRSSSIVISGTPVRRPMGQLMPDQAERPTFGPSRLLDYELELGFLVGPGNALGSRIAIDRAAEHVFGFVLVNDWSARDVQKWEYQPLGPFNAKNFATTISPWVVTAEALAPYRRPGPPRQPDDPPMLEYLTPPPGEASWWSIDLTVEVWLSSSTMRGRGMAPMRVSQGSFADMYWTVAQMLAHHTSTGCNLRPGDLIASGTISGAAEDSRGCLLERTWRGQNPLQLPDGSVRRFLEDGDEVVIRGHCAGDGHARVGMGECRGIVEAAQ